jgi:hypothetical protein
MPQTTYQEIEEDLELLKAQIMSAEDIHTIRSLQAMVLEDSDSPSLSARSI